MMERPNPQVYRDAAELILSEGEVFTCVAIQTAARKHHPQIKLDELIHYSQQYRMACNRFKRHDWRGNPEWWNKPFSLTRRDYRARALLDMADLCEGKPVPLPLGRRI